MKRDLVSGLFWLLMGTVLCAWSSAYQIGTITEPGPGFLPMALGGLVTIFSLILVGSALKSKADSTGKGTPIFAGRWGRVLSTLLVLLVAALLFEKVGYLLTFFLLSLILMFLAGLRSWKQIALIAFCTALGIYLCFVLLLKQPLPTGFLGI